MIETRQDEQGKKEQKNERKEHSYTIKEERTQQENKKFNDCCAYPLKNGLFITDINLLSSNSWKILNCLGKSKALKNESNSIYIINKNMGTNKNIIRLNKISYLVRLKIKASKLLNKYKDKIRK